MNILKRLLNHGPSIDNTLTTFLHHHEAQGTAQRTREWYKDMIGVYAKWCDAQRIGWPRWTERETIDRFLTHERDRGMAASTVAARFRALRAWLNWCEDADQLHGRPSPLRGAQAPKTPTRKPKAVTLDEYRQLMASIERGGWVELRDRAIVSVLFKCGLRASELTGLALTDFNAQERQIHVRGGKGDQDRIVPCGQDAAAAVVEYLMNRPAWDGPELWLSSDGVGGVRTSLSASGVRQLLRRRCDAAGLRRLNPHAFRHGCAVAMLNNGAGIATVQAVLGHSEANTTQIYARWTTAGLQRSYNEAWSTLD